MKLVAAPPVFVRWFGVFWFAAILAMFAAVTRNTHKERPRAIDVVPFLLGATYLATSPTLGFYAGSGMETVQFAAVLLAGFFFAVHPTPC